MNHFLLLLTDRYILTIQQIKTHQEHLRYFFDLQQSSELPHKPLHHSHNNRKCLKQPQTHLMTMFKMIPKKKAGRLTKFGKTIHPRKWDYSSGKIQRNWFNGQKKWLRAVQDCFYGRKHGFDIRSGLVTGRVVPYVFGINKNHRTNRNQSVIDAENGEKKKT